VRRLKCTVLYLRTTESYSEQLADARLAAC